jgi:hypothetical protein
MLSPLTAFQKLTTSFDIVSHLATALGKIGIREGRRERRGRRRSRRRKRRRRKRRRREKKDRESSPKSVFALNLATMVLGSFAK